MCRINKSRVCSSLCCVLSCVLLLCGSFCFCLADELGAADWSQEYYNPTDGKWVLTLRHDGNNYSSLDFPAPDGSGGVLSRIADKDYTDVSCFIFTWRVGLDGAAMGLDGDFYFTFSPPYGADAVSSVYCFATFRDGSVRQVPVSSPSRGDVVFSAVTFPVAPDEISIYFELAEHVTWGVSAAPFGSASVHNSKNGLMLGSGSSLSPTFPAFDNSANSAAAGVVSDYSRLEDNLMNGVASGLSDADDLITDLPNRFTDYLDGFNFWRDIFNAAFREPFLSFLVMVSLSVGVFCIILKILPKVR